MRQILSSVILFLAMICLSGCHSIGPATISRDRFDYSAAMTDSWKSETLLNIVKLRYLDPPVFVDVGQIISGYSFSTGGNAGGSIYPSVNSANNWNVGVNGSYSDHPTITYTPMTGENFLQGVVTPMQPESLFFSIQSGWPADVMLRMGVGAINGLRNETNTTDGHTEPNPKFIRVAQLMRRLQISGAVSIRVRKDKNGTDFGAGTVLAFQTRDVPSDVAADIRELDELLGLDPNISEYRLIYGSMASDRQEIAVLTRSLMNVMTSMAARTQVPPDDVTEGRAMPGAIDGADPTRTKGTFVIHCSLQYPNDSFVAVHYRDHWFWISDRDLASKRDFAFIMLLSTLSDTGARRALPLLTIPTQ